jgi:hypothetical protein
LCETGERAPYFGCAAAPLFDYRQSQVASSEADIIILEKPLQHVGSSSTFNAVA